MNTQADQNSSGPAIDALAVGPAKRRLLFISHATPKENGFATWGQRSTPTMPAGG